MEELTHIDDRGNPQMVDVGDKIDSHRSAKAQAIVRLGEDLLNRLNRKNFNSKKGSVIQTAIVAGNMAVKKTSDLIPLCHPLPINGCTVNIDPFNHDSLKIECTVKTYGKTGVEMEALAGASIAALTIYDMCKSYSKAITIEEVKLIEKKGGKSDFRSAP